MSDSPDIVELLRGCVECLDGFPYARIPPHELFCAAAEIEQLRTELAEAREAARWIRRNLGNGRNSEVLLKWSWLEEEE